jgi:molecular chaperone HscC
VVTVPAYFHEHQRKATLNAGRIAGLDVARILNEPTAAALAYGLHDGRRESILLVFDLGGGTFDVSVVDLMEGAVEVRASSGEGFLGGEDFTRRLAGHVLTRCGMNFERAEADSPRLVSRLIQQCEVAKRILSRSDTADVRIPNQIGELVEGCRVETVRREEFDRWTDHLMARIEMPIRRALGDANLKRADIDEVILVGGATRMPRVVERVAELFGKPPLCRLNPDEVVALGAAVQAGLIARESCLEDLVVTDVAPFTMGIAMSKQLGTEHRTGYFLPIIHRNNTIPVSRVNSVVTIAPNQTEIKIQIYQGEGRRVEENLLLGEFLVKGIPLGPAGQEIDVRFTYDLNGVLEVEATIGVTKETFSHVVTRHARGLTPVQIAQAIKAMQTLKTHPREEAENRFLLRRAERVFGEVGANERAVLGDMLDGFEAAMELGDANAIEQFRDALRTLLDQLDPEMRQETGGEDDGW